MGAMEMFMEYKYIDDVIGMRNEVASSGRGSLFHVVLSSKTC